MTMTGQQRSTSAWDRCVDALDWSTITDELDRVGCAPAGSLLDEAGCTSLIDLYDDDTRFRSTVDMARHRFGEGEYRYFADPLPNIVSSLRAAFWPHLLAVARTWYERLGRPTPWPDRLDDWLEVCHSAGQSRP